MENNNVENAVPAAEHEVWPVSNAAQAAAGDHDKLENGGGVDEHEGVAVTVVGSGGAGRGGGQFREKRKRGRPRKLLGEIRQEFMVVPEYSASPQKRGRGRPRGSGKWQTLAASLGGIAGDTGGSNFTPHIIAIQEGENIVQRILSFSQMTSASICILSASGTISTAEIFLPSSRGGVIRYEGQFAIVSLNGSHTYDEKRGGKICLLSVQLANLDGRFCGGAVAGSLIAAGPNQLVIATFRQNLRQQPSIRPRYLDSPKVNDGTVATPMQAENGKLSDAEVRRLATAQRVDEMAFNGPNLIQSSSAQPVGWKSLQSSASASGV